MVKVVTDSVADLPPEVAEALGITVVPYHVHFGTEDYRDRIDMTPAAFYQKLVKGPVFPTTGAPPPGDFAEAFDRLAEETHEIIVFTVSSKLSASVDSALQGIEQMKNKKCRVEVADSLNAVMAQGFMAIAAVEEARSGKNLDQIVSSARQNVSRVSMRACFDTLEYLRRGGRIGRAAALMGSLLKINPIITIKDGVVAPAGRERSRAKAIESQYRFVEERKGKIRKLAVEYADYGTTPAEAETLAQRLTPLLPPGEHIYMSTTSPVIGAHTGPGTIIISIMEK